MPCVAHGQVSLVQTPSHNALKTCCCLWYYCPRPRRVRKIAIGITANSTTLCMHGCMQCHATVATPVMAIIMPFRI